MQNKSYVSSIEQKLLVAFFLLVSFLFYFHLFQTNVETYNEQVKIEQKEKFDEASIPPDQKISFSICTFGYPPLLTQIFWINFLLLPFVVFLLKKQKFSLFVFSAVINFLTTISIIYWNFYNYFSHLVNETYYFGKSAYGYVGVFSNLTALFLAIASTVFVILQLAIVTRFVFEKNNAKISLR